MSLSSQFLATDRMNPFSPTSSYTSPYITQKAPAHFGFWGGKYANAMTTPAMNTMFEWLGQSRTRELIIEDLGAFGVLRTGWDTLRGVLYGSGGLNGAAGRERFFREALSIFSDIFSSGIAALGIGFALDKTLKSFSNKNIHFQTLELFRDAMAPNGTAVNKHTDFLDNIAEQLANTKLHGGNNAAAIATDVATMKQQLAGVLKQNPAALNIWDDWAQSQKLTLNSSDLDSIKQLFNEGEMLPTAKQLEPELAKLGITKAGKRAKSLLGAIKHERAMELARTMKIEQLDVVLDKHHIKLPELMEDLHRFTSEMIGTTSDIAQRNWEPEAMLKRVKTTFKAKHLRLVGLAIGLTCTMASPLVNHWFTRKKDGVDYYPALDGLYAAQESQELNKAHLKKAEEKKTWLGRWLYRNGPHVTAQVDKGNWLPVLGVLFPMSVPFWFDTVNRKIVKPSLKNFRNMLDFGKVFPFTTQQQIASLFAFLIASRIFSSRSTDELRERAIDSTLGWGLWILGTPLIKNAAAKLNKIPELVKQAGLSGNKILRETSEFKLIKKLAPEEITKLDKLGKSIGRSSLFLNILLLGIIEPLIAIFYTKHASEKRADKKRLEIASRLTNQPVFQHRFNLQQQQTAAFNTANA